MRITILLCSVFSFSLVAPISAQEAAQPQGIYEPGHPNADADGLVWKQAEAEDKTQTQNSKSQTDPDKTQGPKTKSQTSSQSENPQSTGYLSEHYKTAQAQAQAQTPMEGPGIKQTSIGTVILQMLGGLGIVGGLFLLAAAGMKRFYGQGGLLNRGRVWQVVESIPLGPKRTLYVTKFVDRIYLLGATEQQISVIGEIQDATLATAIESGDADFRRFLVPETLNENSNSEVRMPEQPNFSPKSAQEIPVPASISRPGTRSFTV